jgi:hypothetical protein
MKMQKADPLRTVKCNLSKYDKVKSASNKDRAPDKPDMPNGEVKAESTDKISEPAEIEKLRGPKQED